MTGRTAADGGAAEVAARRWRRPRPIRALGSLSLQARFALLAAVAVSAAVLAAAIACYVLVSGQLNNQIDQDLGRQAVSIQHQAGPDAPGVVGGTGSAGGTGVVGLGGPGREDPIDTAVSTCADGLSGGSGTSADSGPGGSRFDPLPGGPELVRTDGTVCVAQTVYPVAFSPQQRSVADGAQNNVYYDTYTTSSAEHVRVYTVQAPGHPGYAVSYVSSLASRDSSLSRLAWELVLAAAAGVGLASLAGLAAARSALRPVRRLTRAVEHVATTEDLSVRLPVTGKDEINRLGASFNKMTRALALSRDRQRRLIADAGHELRTPLTSLRTNVDLLLRSERTGRELPPGRREAMLESVDQQLHELSGLVTDLLELSRGRQDGGPGAVRRTMRIALHESVGRAVERARLRGPGLEFDVEIEPWFVQGDPTGIDRAVVNLLDNAVKFSPPGGLVTVRLREGRYSVADQGPGISPQDLPRVFERFWRSDSARALPGSGLGLAIVAQVAEETGGSVALEPGAQGGTVALLIVPGGAR
jgi:two-component system, OmpR family, sensor histidine kinase MprB